MIGLRGYIQTGLYQELSSKIQAMYVIRNNEARSCNHCCSGKTISITQPVCAFVALVIQYAMRMHHIVLPSVACHSVHYFCTLFQNGHDFRKKSYLI
jgi:hypothetical protein